MPDDDPAHSSSGSQRPAVVGAAGALNRVQGQTCVWPAPASLGEAPFWSVAEQALYWVDSEACAVHRYRPHDGARRSWTASEPAYWLIARASRQG